MTRPVSNLNYSNTFGHVLSTVNLLADTTSRFSVTTNGTGWGDSAVAYGDAYVNGAIHVTRLFANNATTVSLTATGDASVAGAFTTTGSLFSYASGSTNLSANNSSITLNADLISSASKFSSSASLFSIATNATVAGTLSTTGNTSLSSNTLFVNGSAVTVNGQLSVAGGVSATGALSVSNTASFGNTTVARLTATGAVSVSNTASFGNTTVARLTATGAVSVSNTASFGNTTINGLATVTGAVQVGTTLTVTGASSLAALTATGALSVSNTASFGNTTINGFANVNAGSSTSALSVRTTASNTYVSLFNSANVAHRVGLESNTLVFGTVANTALRLSPSPSANNETFNYAGSPESNTVVMRVNGRSVVDGDLIVTGSVRALTLSSNTGDLANLFIRNDIDGNAGGVVTFLAGTRHRGTVRFDTTTDGVPPSPLRWQSEANNNFFEISSSANNTSGGQLRVSAGGSFVANFSAANTVFNIPVYSAFGFYGSLIGNASTAAALQTARNISLGGVLSGSASFNGSENITITASFNGAVPVTAGGTSFSTYAAGDLIYGVGTTSLAKLAINNANNVLITNTGSNFPSWGKVPLSTHVSGTLPVGNLPVAASGASSSTQIVRADDSRLSDARTPSVHALDGAQHSISGKTAGQMLIATGATSFGFTTMSGAATLSGSGVLTLGADSVGTSNIANSAVTNAKLANATERTIKGNAGFVSGQVADLSATQVRDIISVDASAVVYSKTNQYTTASLNFAFGFEPDVTFGDTGALGGTNSNLLQWRSANFAGSDVIIDAGAGPAAGRVARVLNTSALTYTISAAPLGAFKPYGFLDPDTGNLAVAVEIEPRGYVELLSLGEASNFPAGVIANYVDIEPTTVVIMVTQSNGRHSLKGVFV